MLSELLKLNLRTEHIITQIVPPSDELKFTKDGKVFEKNKLFKELETELNSTKDLLNSDYEKIQNGDKELEKFYYEFREISKIYGRPLRNKLMNVYNAQHVTNAWMKFYEIAHKFNWIDNYKKYFGDEKIITAFHNAEFPGAGICAINHYFLSRLGKDYRYEWTASSLWPDSSSEGIFGDQFGIYANNKDRWLMSASGNNGDCTVPENLIDFEERVGKVHIYTSDAGIDVSDDFNNQEVDTIFIHLGCALAGLMTLDIGGMMLLKQYTRFHELSWSLIILYSTLFDYFYLNKPTSSKSTSSEVYLVGIGFKGLPEDIREMLLEKLREKTLTPVINMNAASRELYAESYKSIKEFTIVMNELQSTYLKTFYESIEKIKVNSHLKISYFTKMKQLREKYTEEWINTHDMKKLTFGFIESKQDKKKPFNKFRNQHHR